MIIFGWGKVTKRVIGAVFQRTCSYCNRTEIWQLYILRKWFTLFFIPVIPYGKKYGIGCPSCGSYIELTEQEFKKIKAEITGAPDNSGNTVASSVEDNLKYSDKTETQINYLKQMEELSNKTN